MKKFFVSILSALMLLVVGATPAQAIAPSVVNTTYDFVTTDNGMQGPWATDTFHSELKFTRLTWGVWRVERTDTGTFEVIPGAKSPGGVEGTLVGDGTKGTISGNLTVVIHGVLKSDIPATNGPDDLRGFEGDYYHKYFGRFFHSISSGEIEQWGWTFETCNNGTWVDTEETEVSYPSEAMGDITGEYVPCEKPEEPKVAISQPLSPAGAPVCSAFAPAAITNAVAKRSQNDAVVSYWPTVSGGQVNIRFREVGEGEWKHALRDYPNLGVAPIGFLKDDVKYEFQITNGFGCAQSSWSQIFQGL